MPLRCFLPLEVWPAGPAIRLDGREAHHLIRVLRARKGDSVVCFDGRGQEMECVIQETGAGHLLLQAGPTKQIPAFPCSVTLCAAIPGQGRLEEIVNSATQMGVSEIIPLLTERTVVRFTQERFNRKRDHLQQVAIEAAKQSSTSRLPEIGPLTPWKKILPALKDYGVVLIGAIEGPHEDWRAVLKSLKSVPGTILLLIGPEGDFTSEEIRQAVDCGAHRVSLGPSILRCDTAVTAALSILFFLLRERDR